MSVLAVLLVLAACALNTAAVHHRTKRVHDPKGYVYHLHSITHPYMTNGMTIPNWDFYGSTVVTDDYIRLTPDRQSRRGSLWNTVPFNPPGDEEYPGFEINLQFRVHGQGTRLFGDGMAVWYTKDRALEGPVFGNQDKFIGMGVFFDTYSNLHQGHSQYISVMFGDGMLSYDHDSDGGASRVAGCPIRFRSTADDDHPVYARIVYQNNLLRVYIDADDDGGWPECFIVRRVYLPRNYYFGLTAATGDLADNHDVISMKVSEPSGMSQAEREEVKRRIEEDMKREAESGGSKVPVDPQYGDEVTKGNAGDNDDSNTLTIAAVIIVLVIVAVAGYFVFVKTKKDTRKFDF
ncbi:hypothetical protein PTSG_10232 [Salpingoeca rosetta]|uniref:L-type lectin-like domain-containing protein n=1 Tax=Salpingoeca rosetta (strain ATCC 50818 / BSB-021) TaxID=946362 RepID=F2UQP5_SALR5|nr:uncharacterized protein PTSG_10232 [Salpingoeca rosetta]EGD79950.1 hypothetical protein PTSG_10232 [Salpingoeca rosetta]|eukprot:XP_004988571.1 hypothetical protein PTSG_10232 [Salpingoeca rosetta]